MVSLQATSVKLVSHYMWVSAEDGAHTVKSLLYKHGNLNLDPQHRVVSVTTVLVVGNLREDRSISGAH